jgi:hypothetical protein
MIETFFSYRIKHLFIKFKVAMFKMYIKKIVNYFILTKTRFLHWTQIRVMIGNIIRRLLVIFLT